MQEITLLLEKGRMRHQCGHQSVRVRKQLAFSNQISKPFHRSKAIWSLLGPRQSGNIRLHQLASCVLLIQPLHKSVAQGYGGIPQAVHSNAQPLQLDTRFQIFGRGDALSKDIENAPPLLPSLFRHSGPRSALRISPVPGLFTTFFKQILVFHLVFIG